MTYNYQFWLSVRRVWIELGIKNAHRLRLQKYSFECNYIRRHKIDRCDFAAHEIDLESRMLCVYRSVRRGYYNMYSVLRVLQTQPGMDVNANI